MRQQPRGKGKDRQQRQAHRDAFTETLTPLAGLGQEERGNENSEVHENAIRLGDAQLDRTGPEG